MTLASAQNPARAVGRSSDPVARLPGSRFLAGCCSPGLPPLRDLRAGHRSLPTRPSASGDDAPGSAPSPRHRQCRPTRQSPLCQACPSPCPLRHPAPRGGRPCSLASRRSRHHPTAHQTAGQSCCCLHRAWWYPACLHPGHRRPRDAAVPRGRHQACCQPGRPAAVSPPALRVRCRRHPGCPVAPAGLAAFPLCPRWHRFAYRLQHSPAARPPAVRPASQPVSDQTVAEKATARRPCCHRRPLGHPFFRPAIPKRLRHHPSWPMHLRRPPPACPWRSSSPCPNRSPDRLRCPTRRRRSRPVDPGAHRRPAVRHRCRCFRSTRCRPAVPVAADVPERSGRS